MCGPRPVTDRSPAHRFSNRTSSSIAPQHPPSPTSDSASVTHSVGPDTGSEFESEVYACFACMMANRPVLEKYNEHLSGPAKVVDATRTHMTVVKMSKRAAAPGIIKPVEPLVPRTMRHSATDQYTLAPPAKQINQRDRNKRLRIEQQIPPADKFKQGDFNGQGVAAPVDSVYEIAREKCEQWMATWIGDCGRTVPKQVPAQMPDLPPEKQNMACPKHSPLDQAGPGVFRENHPTKAPRKFQRTSKRTMVTDEDGFTGKFRFHTRSTIGHLGKRAAEVMAPKNTGMPKTACLWHGNAR